MPERLRECENCVNYWVNCMRCEDDENCEEYENSGFVRLAPAQAHKKWHSQQFGYLFLAHVQGSDPKKCDPRLLKRQNSGIVRLTFAQAGRQQARQINFKKKSKKKKNKKLSKQKIEYKDFSEI